jgi:transcriptional regulator with GAF, ATPase, and Fis domain
MCRHRGGAVAGADIEKRRRPRGGGSEKRPVTQPSDSDALSSASAQLLGLLVEAPDLDAFLDRMVRLAADLVTPAAACGLTIRRDGLPFTVAASDELASRVDLVQYGADDGPCVDGLRHGVVIQVDDLAQERRWDSFREHAVAQGVRSSLSLPLKADGVTLGALNLYALTRKAFDEQSRKSAEVFAQQCAAALTVSLRRVEEARVQRQLADAMVSRSIIDQAIGVLMARHRCGANEAFDRLRQASQHRNRKLREIAADIITAVTGQPPQLRPGFRPAVDRPGTRLG